MINFFNGDNVKNITKKLNEIVMSIKFVFFAVFIILLTYIYVCNDIRLIIDYIIHTSKLNYGLLIILFLSFIFGIISIVVMMEGILCLENNKNKKKSLIFFAIGVYIFIFLMITIISSFIFLETPNDAISSTVAYPILNSSVLNSTEIILNKTISSKLINSTTTTTSYYYTVKYSVIFYLGVLTLTSIFFWKLLDTIKNYDED